MEKASVPSDGEVLCDSSSIKLTDILTSKLSSSSSCWTVEIHHADLTEDLIRVKVAQSSFDNKEKATQFHQKIKEGLSSDNRPKHLLVFINPGSGKYKGVSLYETNVKPIFDLCGITTEEIVTKSHGEARSTLLSRDLNGVDGVVVVGGDGSFGDAAQALLERAWKEAGEEEKFKNLASTKFVPNKIPIAHMPGGSGNGYACCVSGSHDATTSAILVALGRKFATDVTVYAGIDERDTDSTDENWVNKMRSAPSQFWGFGVLFSIISNTDMKAFYEFDAKMRKKWGPFRYFVCSEYMKSSTHPVVLTVHHQQLPDDEKLDDSVCCMDCPKCNKIERSNNTGQALDWNVATVEDKKNVTVTVTPLRSLFTPKAGSFPFVHLGDGVATLISFNYLSIFRFILHITGLLRDDYCGANSSPYRLDAKEMIITNGSNVSSSPLHLAMEETFVVVDRPLHVLVCRQLLQTFGTGLRDKEFRPQRARQSVISFLAHLGIKVAVVVGLIGILIGWRNS